MKILCVIPARLNSTRFPHKLLAKIKGKPLLQWVWEAASQVPLFDDLVIATDSESIIDLAKTFHAPCILTSPSCTSGTDRLIELSHKKTFQADIWVNWQGDEPLIHSAMIDNLLQDADPGQADVWTLQKRIISAAQINNPHIAKVVCDAKGFALYFSRSPIPYHRDTTSLPPLYHKHIGLYAFSSAALEKLHSMPPCAIEQAEQLEQLRFLYHNLRVRVRTTEYEVVGVDLPEHLLQVEALLDLLHN